MLALLDWDERATGHKPYLPWAVRERLLRLSRTEVLRFFHPGTRTGPAPARRAV